MKLRLDPGSQRAIYLQIVEQVRSQVARGELAPGRRLPSVRELALTLRINPNTAARAYRELEREDIVVRQQGRGVFVVERRSILPARERQRQLDTQLDALLVDAWQLGIEPSEVIERLKRRAATFSSDRSPEEGQS